MEIEIFAHDLTTEAQQAICEQLGIKSLSEMNWDVFPLATIVIDN